MAYENEEDIHRYVEEGLTKSTAQSYRNTPDFLTMLKKVKEQGYATSIEELHEGIATIATPIRDYTGKVVYSLSVLGPVHRFDPHNPSVISKVKKITREIFKRAGYRGTE